MSADMRVEDTGFGYVVIDGVRYEYDVVLCGEKVLRRPKELSRKYRGLYGHTPLSTEEMKELLNLCPEARIVVIGTGQYGALPVPEEAIREAEKRGKRVIMLRTPEVSGKLSELSGEGRVLAVIHVTC